MIKELEQYTSGRLPDIKSDGEISKVISFNESYINQFLFEPDDLLKNSHSILIDTDSFKNEVRDINSLVATIQATITGNSEITQHITNLNTFINSIKLTNADKINATSPFHKAMKDGNLFVSPATEITRYGELIKKSEWIAWHKTGTDKFFDSDIEACPFCTSDITETQIESIESVKKSFTKVQVDHLVNSLSVLENLSSIVSESNTDMITEIQQSTNKFNDDYEEFVVRLRLQASSLVKKLETVKSINYHELKTMETKDLKDILESYKINKKLYPDFNTSILDEIALSVNTSIEDVVNGIGVLIGKINKHKSKLHGLIKYHEGDINDFLVYAGFKYSVKLIEEGEEYKLKLFPSGSNLHINDVKTKLSYGEKNVFAITLFLFEALNEEYDLIILDDPISSFDKSKKFAILHRLFKGDNSLVNRTVLLATHDFDVVLDLGYVKRKQYLPYVTFMKNESGILTETEILKKDILSYKKICFDNIKKYEHSFIRFIYTRRLLDIVKDLNESNSLSWNYLSSLLHRYPEPTVQQINDKGEIERSVMTEKQIEDSIENIFNLYGVTIGDGYSKMLALTDEDILEMYRREESRFVKLQLFRILHQFHKEKHPEEKKEKDRENIILKFMNETYHTENDYLYDLDPNKFERVPEYVIDLCDQLILTF